MFTNRTLALTLVGTTAIVMIGAAVWPLANQRDASIDRAIESDFATISASVEEYYSDRNRLPDELADLSLDDKIAARAGRYNSTFEKESSRKYELCADFKTDTKTESASPSETFLYDGPYGQNREHLAGHDCIDYEVYGYYYGPTEPVFDSSSSDAFEGGFDFGEDSVPIELFDPAEIQQL